MTVTHHGDGGCQRGKIERYLALLKQALAEEPNNSRHVFYTGESYRDLGNFPQAIEWYEKRASMGGWDEDWSADSHVRAFLASDQVRADKAVRAPASAFLESALFFASFPIISVD